MSYDPNIPTNVSCENYIQLISSAYLADVACTVPVACSATLGYLTASATPANLAENEQLFSNLDNPLAAHTSQLERQNAVMLVQVQKFFSSPFPLRDCQKLVALTIIYYMQGVDIYTSFSCLYLSPNALTVSAVLAGVQANNQFAVNFDDRSQATFIQQTFDATGSEDYLTAFSSCSYTKSFRYLGTQPPRPPPSLPPIPLPPPNPSRPSLPPLGPSFPPCNCPRHSPPPYRPLTPPAPTIIRHTSPIPQDQTCTPSNPTDTLLILPSPTATLQRLLPPFPKATPHLLLYNLHNSYSQTTFSHLILRPTAHSHQRLPPTTFTPNPPQAPATPARLLHARPPLHWPPPPPPCGPPPPFPTYSAPRLSLADFARMRRLMTLPGFSPPLAPRSTEPPSPPSHPQNQPSPPPPTEARPRPHAPRRPPYRRIRRLHPGPPVSPRCPPAPPVYNYSNFSCDHLAQFVNQIYLDDVVPVLPFLDDVVPVLPFLDDVYDYSNFSCDHLAQFVNQIYLYDIVPDVPFFCSFFSPNYILVRTVLKDRRDNTNFFTRFSDLMTARLAGIVFSLFPPEAQPAPLPPRDRPPTGDSPVPPQAPPPPGDKPPEIESPMPPQAPFPPASPPAPDVFPYCRCDGRASGYHEPGYMIEILLDLRASGYHEPGYMI
eukprot:gene20384-27155_t